MATLVIKNFPDDLHAKLKDQAQAHNRSLAKEALTVIEQGMENISIAPVPYRLPPPVRVKGGRLTIEDIEAAIAEGRE